MARPSVMLMHRCPPENAGGLDAIEAAIRERLPDVPFERAADYGDALDRIPDAEVVIEHRIDDDLLAAADDLGWLQSLSAGYDRFDLDALADRGVALTTVSGAHATPAAQHVLGSVLQFERGLGRARRQADRREWRRFTPDEPTGKTAGVVGVGTIGARTAQLLSAVGMEVLGVKRDLDDVPDAVDEIYPPDELHTVLGRSDYVVAACPLTDETRGMFDAGAFVSMGPEAVFVNVARGAVADQAALVEALRTGNLGGAALDVAVEEPLPADSPLWGMENVLVTPHMAGGSPRFADRAADVFAENYERYAAGEADRMTNRVV